MGSRTFCTQYQRDPQHLGSGIIKNSWIQLESQQVIQEKLSANLESPPETIISIDFAIKNRSNNDFSAISIWQFPDPTKQSLTAKPPFPKTQEPKKNPKTTTPAQNNNPSPKQQPLYTVDIIHEKYEFFELVTKVIELLIEDKTSGSSLIQELNCTASNSPQSQLSKTKFIEIRPSTSKEHGIIAYSVLFEAKRVIFNKDTPCVRQSNSKTTNILPAANTITPPTQFPYSSTGTISITKASPVPKHVPSPTIQSNSPSNTYKIQTP